MKRAYLTVLFVCLFVFSVSGQTDMVGSGRALQFDGIDDYIDLGNVYDDLTLPFSVSVWVYVDPTTTAGPVLVSQDNNSLYNGFWFIVSRSTIAIEYGDGGGDNHHSFRRGKSATAQNIGGQWIHASAVMKGANDIDLYINGVNVGGSYGGSSTLPMASAYPSDVAKIGYFFSNGITYRFKGKMDELRLYNRALTQAEIRETMCRRLNGDEPGLIGYWNFDEVSGNILYDHSPKGFDGQLKGDPQRIYSGAPVGDESLYLYTTNWTGVTLVKESDTDRVEVDNVYGTGGIHIYEVKNLPSQTAGMDVARTAAPYFGVFATAQHLNYGYELDYRVTGSDACSFYSRADNSESSWSEITVPAVIAAERIEVIKYADESGVTFKLDLGDDLEVCNLGSTVLSSGVDPSGKEFLWSTGEQSESIHVSEPGSFSLEVRAGCEVGRDTVSVMFLNSPESFSLGSDEVLCEFKPRLLQAQHPLEGFEFTWQDNSSDTAFHAERYGLYWLKISNACGTSSDSVRFVEADLSGYQIPSVITPNGDSKNEYFILHPLMTGSRFSVFNRWGKQVYTSPSYQNDWDGGHLPSGVYYYTLSGDCVGHDRGVIRIFR